MIKNQQKTSIAKYLSNFGLFLYSWDPQSSYGHALFNNPSLAKLTGYPLSRFQNWSFWFSLVFPDDQALVDEMLEKLKRGEPYTAHYRFVDRESKVLWVSDRARPILRREKVIRIEGVLRDITERKKVEEALKESEARFRIALQNSPIAVFNQDLNLRYTWLYKPQLALDATATIGKDDYDIFPYEDAIHSSAIKQRILDTKALVREEFKVTQNGQTTYLDLTGEPLLDSFGHVIGITCATMDITERKIAEEKLRSSEARFRSIFENAAVGVALVNKEGRIITANETYCRFLGLRQEDLINEEHPEYTWSDDLNMSETLADGSVNGYGLEKRFIHSDGKVVWGRVNLSVVKDPEGVPKYAIVVCEDITKRKQTEEALRENQRILQRITDSTPTLIYIFNMVERKNIYANKTAAAFLNDSTGQTEFIMDTIHPGDQTTWEQLRQRLLLAKDEDVIEVTFRMKDRHGSWRTLQSWNMVFSRSADGYAKEILVSAMDITEHQDALQAIREYQQQLLRLASEMSISEEHERRQIAVALHDQIGQVLAMARMKLRAELKSVSQSPLKDNLNQVIELIEEALKQTRSLTFELSPPILEELGFEAAVQWLVNQMRNRFGLKVLCHRGKDPIPLKYEMSVLLYQAVRELLTNVIKHAQVRTAHVSIKLKKDLVQIMVKDNGVGFHATTIDNTFRPGGFGLFSIRERLKYVGGSIQIESQPGKGTVVRISVPLHSETLAKMPMPLHRRLESPPEISSTLERLDPPTRVP
jgi:PAS domain S-box-containing protein